MIRVRPRITATPRESMAWGVTARDAARMASGSVEAWRSRGDAALVGAAAAYVLWYEGVKRIVVTRTVAYHYLVPFVAVLVSALFLGDTIKPLTIFGGVAIIAGVALVQRKGPSVQDRH